MFTLLLIALCISLAIELSRLNDRGLKRLFYNLFGLILRKHEHMNFTGSTYLIFAAMLCVAFYKPDIAFLSLAYLSVGDTFAAIIGMNWGKRKFVRMKKSLEGSLACFISTVLFAMFFRGEVSYAVSLMGALIATLAELWNIPIDDNLKLPLLSGFSMTVIGAIF